MRKKLINKIMVVLMIIALTMPNVTLLCSEVYAEYEELEKQGVITNNKNVEFDTYFKENDSNIHSKVENIENIGKLYFKITVKNSGYLKDGKLQISNPNFKLSDDISDQTEIQSIDTNNSTIYLNKVSKENSQIEVPIYFQKQELFDTSYLDRESKVTLSGTYLDENGKEREINSEVIIRLKWKSDINVKLSQEVQRYIQFTENDKEITMIQTDIKTGIENNKLPVESTNIKIAVPEIKGIKPEEVKVIANTTIATNGIDNGLEFDKNNWNYDKEKGIVTIDVKNNANSENKVNWKNGEDEYKLVYIYTGIQKAEKIQLKLSSESEIKVYSADKYTAKEDKQVELGQQLGNIAEFSIKSTKELDKGYMYANSEYETEYKTIWSAEILYTNSVQQIKMEQDSDKFVTYQGNVEESNTYYKSTTISKKNFEKILGQEGKIDIYSNENKIVTIDINTLEDENGNLVVNYSNKDINNIKIVTTKPVLEGKLVFENTKAIKPKADYNIEKVKEFKQINTNIIGISINNEKINVKETKNTQINLNETTTKADLYISNTNLSTVVKNENIQFKAILKSNTSKDDLYKNPSIEIKLPSEITDVEIKSVDLLFSDELKIKSYNVDTNSNDEKIIKIGIEGEQTKFTTDINQGISIVINTDLTLNKIATTNTRHIVMTYSNEKAIKLENDGIISKDINIVAPSGLVTLNSISNYNDKKQEIVSLSGTEQTGELDIQGDAQTATMKLTIINNNGNSIKNPKILGRVPFIGNKKITGEELGTNIDTKLKEAIVAEGIENSKVSIYYTENGEASEDLENSDNGWTTTVQDFSKVKSYLIILNDYEMKQGETISFIYNVEIPEKLGRNQSAYTTYAVYYDNLQEGQAIKARAISPTVGVSTGEGPILDVNVVNNAGERPTTNQAIKYTITIVNNGNKTSEGTKLNVKIPDGTDYAVLELGNGFGDEYKTYPEQRNLEFNIGNIAPKTTVTAEFEVKPNKEGTISTNAVVTATNLEKEVQSNNIENTIYKAYMDVQLSTPSKKAVAEDEEVRYVLAIGNLTEYDINNIKANIKIDDNLEYKEAYLLDENGEKYTSGVNYDKKSNTVTYNVGTVSKEQYKEMAVIVKAEALANGVDKQTTKMYADVTADNIPDHKSNEIGINIAKPKLEVNTSSSIQEGYIKVGDKIDYTITIKNVGELEVNDVKATVNIPTNLKYLNTKYSLGGKEEDAYIFNDNKSEINVTIPAGETLTMVVSTVANKINESEEGKDEDISTKIEVEAPDIDKIENEIKHTVENTGTETEDGEVTQGTYKISGIAWLDENKNGMRDDNEKVLSGVNVTLINEETGKVVKNQNGEYIKATTGEDGKYVLSGLGKGKYLVVFDYDNKQYSITDYQKAGVDDSKNSDAINTTVNEENVKGSAITNTVSIINSSKANIDIGLITAFNFDLKLDKTVSKITMQNSKGTTTKTYDDSKLAKIDLDGKQINNTNLIIEYKIKVTNEGNVEGYAKKIIDYMPKELKFNSELNKDWYLNDNGDLINASLSNTKINPGESKEITLVLTKKMTESGNGIVNNTAEILESYNDYGIADIDSTAGNKLQGEDDMSSADTIIGLKTGREVMYITLTITVIITIGIGAYLVNKKVLKV